MQEKVRKSKSNIETTTVDMSNMCRDGPWGPASTGKKVTQKDWNISKKILMILVIRLLFASSILNSGYKY